MHGTAGLHSALAIKRQRRVREAAKKRVLERERRLSSSTNSVDLDCEEGRHLRRIRHPPPDHSSLASSIGMLHLGVCFLCLGIILMGSGLLPDEVVTWRRGGWWNELLASGLFVTALGVFLISLHRVVGKREENDLNAYVQSQLTRSRSGHRLERDVETGCLTTKHHRRAMEQLREDRERGLEDNDLPPVHTPKSRHQSEEVFENGETPLEKILEEEIFERNNEDAGRRFDFDCVLKETISTTTTASLSPGTPSETRELLSNGRPNHHHSRM